nr:hypothetical protein [Corynebacterium guaraldiae]
MNIPEENFARSPEPTLGVEWEVALVDPVTWDLVPRAPSLSTLSAPPTPPCTWKRNSSKTRWSW